MSMTGKGYQVSCSLPHPMDETSTWRQLQKDEDVAQQTAVTLVVGRLAAMGLPTPTIA
jgi:hypothetical protein